MVDPLSGCGVSERGRSLYELQFVVKHYFLFYEKYFFMHFFMFVFI